MQPDLTRDRLSILLQASAGRRIAVIGDAMLDVYLTGDVERISPEAPVPVVRVRDKRMALGGAANVAQNVVAMGATCDLVCVVGDDHHARELRVMLASIGAPDHALVQTVRPTTTKTRVVARAQQLVRVDEEDDEELNARDVPRLIAAVQLALENADAVVLEDYNKGVLVTAVIDEAMSIARRRGIPVVVDPKYRNFFAYRGATIFKPNRRELESALGATMDVEHPETLPALVRRLGVANVLLTLGDRGMVLVGESGETMRVPTMAREVYDVVGAGDTVTAYLATMLAAGASAAEAAVIANFAAGVEVGKLGAATVSADELLRAYDEVAERG
jgi:rfaE bifunctional protein kinase chain/domain